MIETVKRLQFLMLVCKNFLYIYIQAHLNKLECRGKVKLKL